MQERAHGSSDVLTVVAIAIVAYAACDMTHEVLGHGIAAALSPDVDALSLSSVALQTSTSSRFVAAAGAAVNILAGIAVLGYVATKPRFSNLQFFLWLFGTLNLLNGTGYLLFSGLLMFGDLAVVISGLEPRWAWRAGMLLIGAATYAASVIIAARILVSLMNGATLTKSTVPRLVITSYIAGGLLFVAASALNPISVSLIWLSGVSSGFGAMFGLLIIPALVERRVLLGDQETVWVGRSRAWQGLGLIVAILFIALLGPGIKLK